MPSPAGHMLSGLVLGALPTSENSRVRTRRLVIAALAAAVADMDMLLVFVGFDYFKIHRTFTHSFISVFAILVLLWGLNRFFAYKNSKIQIPYLLISACLFMHPALDLLSEDVYGPRGLTIFWPLLSSFYYPAIDIFPSPFTNLGKALPLSSLFVIGLKEFFLISIPGLALITTWRYLFRRRHKI
ncbi:MAG: metal-dependent hydrolase [Thermodesulfobacteriota bacterium]